MQCSMLDAYKLFHDGTLALSQVESNGIKIDVDYLKRMETEIDGTIRSYQDAMFQDPIYRTWRRVFSDRTKIGSREQLARILFDEMKLPPPGYTQKSLNTDKKRYVTDESVLSKIDLPFVKIFLKVEKLKKLKNTYIQGILREVVDGYIHPVFNLHTVITYRSSSDSPNFQNMPIRNKEIGAIIRRAFIPRKGRYLVEVDFSGIEVRAAAWYHKDPVMLKYICDPTTDMHRDTAMELFLLSKEDVEKRTTRDWAKNRFVFPEFYGSVYFQCAPHLWEVASLDEYKVPSSGVSIRQHLASKGITSLGRCDPKEKPVKGTFEYHVKEVEDSFWNTRFKVYTEWKKEWMRRYQDKGRFRMLTGFTVSGVMKRNEVINYPIQGVAFHCLLWSLVKIQKIIEKKGMKAKIIGQIHDSILADVPKREIQEFLSIAKKTMTVDLPGFWKFIITPLEVEADVSDTNWHEKVQWIEKEGVWGPAK